MGWGVGLYVLIQNFELDWKFKYSEALIVYIITIF